MSDLEQLLASWDGVGVFLRHDVETGSWIFVAVHDTTLGPALGGCRMQVYPSAAEGLRDAMRLAEGMTQKWAVLGFPFGGGKAVLALRRPLGTAERSGLLRRFGRLVESLRGSYMTGEDLGTTPSDMATVAEETRFVHGIDRATGEAIDPGPFTALGVFTSIRTALRHSYGDPALRGRVVLVQGAGDVGRPLIDLLHGAGATVLVSDLDSGRARRAVEAAECGVVPPEAALDTECDVLAPCAVGGILDQDAAQRLRCRIVAGSANNQLADDEVAVRLHQRGILFAPDYVINAGGAVALPMFHQGASEVDVRERIERIGLTLDEILAEAAERSEPPLLAARRRVERVLAAGRRAHPPARPAPRSTS